MQRHDLLTQMNWPYVAFVITTAACGLGFIAWSITFPALRAASAGEPLPGGWAWWSVCTADALAFAVFAGLLWEVHKDAHTRIDAHGISQPSLRGQRQLAWTDVQRCEIFRGVGWHLYGPDFRIVVTPYAYRNPRSVIAALHELIGRRPTRRCS